MGHGDLVHSSQAGAPVAQLVKHQTLDFGSGHYLGVVRLRLELGSMLSKASA